ncbi:hypothetical protein ES702_07881 [subsurface metagenome]
MDKNEIRQAIAELERKKVRTLEKYEIRESEIRRLLNMMDENKGQKH